MKDRKWITIFKKQWIKSFTPIFERFLLHGFKNILQLLTQLLWTVYIIVALLAIKYLQNKLFERDTEVTGFEK